MSCSAQLLFKRQPDPASPVFPSDSRNITSSVKLLDQQDRSLVSFPPISIVVNNRENKHSPKHRRRPVESQRIEFAVARPARPEKDEGAVEKSGSVYPDAVAA